jgi:hypothetical protein
MKPTTTGLSVDADPSGRFRLRIFLNSNFLQYTTQGNISLLTEHAWKQISNQQAKMVYLCLKITHITIIHQTKAELVTT